MIADPESFPDTYSIPVPTIGASGSRSGTACRCMLAPISARLESSFSKNGMQAVAAETTCFGDTSYNLFFHAEQSCFPRGTEQQLLRLQSDLPHQAVCSLVLRYSCPLHPQSNSQSGR